MCGGGNACGDDVTQAAFVVTFDSDDGVGMRLVRGWRHDLVTVSALIGVVIELTVIDCDGRGT
jgi:hypothetical protein